MASSLALQLAQNASLNSALLTDRSKKRAPESYLFSAKDADAYDLESILALATNALLQLALLNSGFSPFENTLFSRASKGTDRTLLAKDANKQLDKSIGKFLSLLGPYVMEPPAGKVLEWLVRRYRVHEFNVDQIIATFLPYHESPHFASMLSILHIKPNSTWSFLLPTKSAALPLSRYTLVTEMLKNTDVTRFIINLLPDNLKKKSGPPPHRTLLAFNLSCLHDFISRSKRLDEGTMVALLPALLEPMQNVDAPKDALLGSYILLTVLSQKCDLSEVALKAIIAAMSSCAVRVTTRQFFSAAVAVASPQPLCSSAFSNTVVDNILSLEDIEAELSEAATWVGFDKLVAPILPRLVEKDEAETVLADLLAKQTTPDEILTSISQSLLKHLISNPASVSTRNLLSSFHLRKPDLLKSASERILEENEELETRVDQVLLSLAVPATSASTTGTTQLDADAVVRSMDADESVRISGIQALLNTGAAQAKPIYPTLITRIQDTSISVLDALYKPTFASLILETDPTAYCKALILVFSSTSGMKRALVRTHLTFLLTHIYVHLSEELEDDVFWKCIFPFLLYTKPREKTCEAVWDAIRDVQIDVLKGCCAIFFSSKEKGSEVMGNVVQRMAENVVGSDRFDRHLTGLVEGLAVDGKGKSDGHVVNLSWMVLKVMVETLKGSELQVDVALRVLDVDEGERLSEQDWAKWSFGNDILDETSLGRHVMGKPNSSSTRALLRIAFLHSVVSSISPPQGIVLDWLTSSPPREHVQGARYVSLVKHIWELTQTSNAGSPAITTQLLSTLFGTLGSANILLFLAGIWSSQSNSPTQQENALDYGRAYLQAHLPREQVQDPVAVDFQTILPSLLVALQSTVEGVRRRALACVRALSEITERKKFEGGQSPLFGFDVVYGATDREIQYLEQNDLKKYLKIILDHEDHLLNDPQYLSTVHQEYIKSKSGEQKKEAEFKHHIRCYLFSHVNALLLPTGQIALLRCLQGISDSDRVDILEHSIESVVREETRGAMDNIYGEHFEEFSALILESFDAGCKDEMNKGLEDEGVAWKLLCRSLRAFVPSAGGSSVIKEALDRTVQTSLYPALSVARKVDLINVVLEIGTSNPSAYPPARVFLLKLDLEVAVIAKVLAHLQPKDEHSSPAPKKARLSTRSEDPVPRLSLFAEVLASALLPDSVELISHLLTTLNSVVLHVAQQQTDVNYLEQLLMTAVDKVASQIMDPPNITPSTIRLDVLVELIRVSGNPQTFQQALLLTATLARLAPESVMRHIMPVFTFMGSNVFHRDDTYSFRVVQKTIESIVPVMISSLRQSTTDRISLYLGARDLLRVFVDAYNHIPRHRRTSLFIHLIDTLGPTDFLAPVCMLLTEKFATRVVRQRSEDAQNTLALPLAVLHHYSPPLQLFALTEVLREARRLAMRLNDLRDVEPHLLDWATQDDRSPAINTLLRKRSQALIIFSGLGMKGGRPSHVGQAADMPSEGSIHDFVFLLMSLFTLEGSPDLKLEELSTAAMVALNRSMGFMAAKDFIHSVVMILDSGQEKLQSGALALLAERLHLVTEKTRRDSQANMLKIVKEIHVLAKKKNLDAAIVPQALQALAVIGKTMLIGEENSLSETLPVVLLALRQRKCTEDALLALSPMSERLGPRLIPHFRELVTQCVAVMRETSSSPRTLSTCLDILSNLLRTIPSFWSQKEIAQVVMLYISNATADSLYLSLGKTLSKRAPAEALVATLIECWVEIPKQISHLLSYFQLLKRALRVASKQVIIEYTRAVFDVFVKGLDVLKDLRNATEAENALIGSFIELVVKLNDTAFRPLFRKLYDWAFVKESSNDSTKIIFCHLFYGLLDYFKSLMNPYMTFLFPPFSEVLKTVPGGGPIDYMLWSGVVSALSASMNCDEGNIFWRDDKLTTLLPALVSQIPHVARASPHLKDQLSSALSALAEVTSSTSSDILKQLNLTVLMHTRSSSAAVRQYALVIAESLWGTHGGKLLGFVADAATFIVESAEDENEEVVKMALKLKETIENIAGKIDLS